MSTILKIKSFIDKSVYEESQGKFNSIEDMKGYAVRYKIITSLIWIALVVGTITTTFYALPYVGLTISKLGVIALFMVFLVVSMTLRSVKDYFDFKVEHYNKEILNTAVSVEPIKNELSEVYDKIPNKLTIKRLNKIRLSYCFQGD